MGAGRKAETGPGERSARSELMDTEKAAGPLDQITSLMGELGQTSDVLLLPGELVQRLFSDAAVICSILWLV